MCYFYGNESFDPGGKQTGCGGNVDVDTLRVSRTEEKLKQESLRCLGDGEHLLNVRERKTKAITIL